MLPTGPGYVVSDARLAALRGVYAVEPDLDLVDVDILPNIRVRRVCLEPPENKPPKSGPKMGP